MKSRMTGDCHVRFCERFGGKCPLPTRSSSNSRPRSELNLLIEPQLSSGLIQGDAYCVAQVEAAHLFADHRDDEVLGEGDGFYEFQREALCFTAKEECVALLEGGLIVGESAEFGEGPDLCGAALMKVGLPIGELVKGNVGPIIEPCATGALVADLEGWFPDDTKGGLRCCAGAGY